MSTRLTTALLALVIAAHYSPAQADDQQAGAQQAATRIGDTPQGLASLIGTEADETDLKRLGYDWVRGSDEGDGRHALWYNAKNRQCVRVRVDNNRYQSITAIDARQCTDPQAYRIGETPQGLASLIGTKADGTDLRRLGFDWVQGSDKGDGRQGLWYHPDNKHCVRTRIDNNHYQSITAVDPRECTEPQAYRVGETPKGLASLIGTKADGADLKRLGFNWVQGSDKGDGRQGLWYHPDNKHCVRTRIENNHYQSITAVDARECTDYQANRTGEMPQGLAGLVGTQADEDDLKRMGYQWIQGSDEGAGRRALWYNANNSQCVRVRIEGDRYQSITAVNPDECTKR